MQRPEVLKKYLFNKEVDSKHAVPKNNLSAWVKSTQKVFSTFAPSKVTAKQKKLRVGVRKQLVSNLYLFCLKNRSKYNSVTTKSE